MVTFKRGWEPSEILNEDHGVHCGFENSVVFQNGWETKKT